MFIDSEHLHLTYDFPINVVVRALDSQSSSRGFRNAGWLQDKRILSSFWDWLNEYQELPGTEW